jgi:DNA-binding transcriptional ArsR family regulator
MSGPRYSIIPAAAVVDPRLEGRDLQVLALLGTHTNEDGWCRRSQVKMAEQLRVARSTVQAALRRLGEAEYVEVKIECRRDGGDASHWYRVRLDVTPQQTSAAGAHVLSDDDTPADRSAPPADRSAPPAGPGSAPPAGPGSAPLTKESNDQYSTNTPKAPKGAREARASDDDEDGFARFFESWTSADPAHEFDRKGAAFAAWKRLSVDERSLAASVDTIKAFVTGQRRAKRTKLMNAATYLRDKAFERVRAAAAAPGSSELVPLSLFGRAWWCRFFRFAEGGSRTPAAGKAKFMAQQAERGQGVAVPLAEAQALEATSASFAYVLIASPDFVAWREWFAERGFRLPRPAKVDRIWMPSARPPDTAVAEAAQ